MSRVQIFVLGSAVVLLLSVLNLVRRRRLREEYSWLWLLTSVSFLLVALSSALYTRIVRLIGANNAALAFTFLGLYFLVLISIQFSVQLSRLVTRSKDLAQEIAILDGEIRKLQQGADATANPEAGNSDSHRKGDLERMPSGSTKRAEEEVSTHDWTREDGAAQVPVSEFVSSPPSTEQDHAERSFD
jgi:hypothetical protein